MSSSTTSPPTGPSVSSKVLRAVVLAAKTANLDIPALFARYKVTPEELADPDARFDNNVWLGMWREIDASGTQPFGLLAAKALPQEHFDVIDYVMSASADLGEALQKFERYFALVSTGAKHILVEDGKNGVRLERHFPAGAHTTIPHPAEFAFAAVVLRSRKMVGVEYRPVEVRFAHRKPLDDRAHREAFLCPVYFDAPVSYVLFDRESLALPTLAPRPELARILERHGDAILAKLATQATDDIRARTKEAIIAGLKHGHTSVAEIAKRLGMSDRTLQRRLGELDTSHAKLLDEARSELAVRYLSEPSVSIPEVALLLGFSDVSTFHRAFRRWKDATPAEHRKSVMMSRQV